MKYRARGFQQMASKRESKGIELVLKGQINPFEQISSGLIFLRNFQRNFP